MKLKTMLRKSLSLALCAALFLSLVPAVFAVPALAAAKTPDQGGQFASADGGVCLFDTGETQLQSCYRFTYKGKPYAMAVADRLISNEYKLLGTLDYNLHVRAGENYPTYITLGIFELESSGSDTIIAEAEKSVYVAVLQSVKLTLSDHTCFNSQAYTDPVTGLSDLKATLTGTLGTTTVTAAVTCTTALSGQTLTLTGTLTAAPATENETVMRPAGDTVEALNAYLVLLGQEIAGGTTYDYQHSLDIQLAQGSYSGTIVVPETISGHVALVGARTDSCSGDQHEWDCSKTTLTGGIELRGTLYDIQDIVFTAPSAANVANVGKVGKVGVWCNVGGAMLVDGCTFSGYDYAIYSDPGFIFPGAGNYFHDNTTAFYLNATDSTRWWGASTDATYDNLFSHNRTAINIHTLPDKWASPYNYRLKTCNFIDNTTDIICPSVGGLFFFGKCFYGTSSTTAGVTTYTMKQSPAVTGNATVCPCYDKPTYMLDSFQGTAGNLVIPATVSSAPLENITGTDSGILISSITAREAGSPLTLTVLSTADGSTPLGSWILTGTADLQDADSGTETAATTFNYGLTVTSGGSEISVTPCADESALSQLSPTLSIPITGTAAEVYDANNQKLASSISSGAVSFTAATAGTYRIVIPCEIGEVTFSGGTASFTATGVPAAAGVYAAAYDAAGRMLALKSAAADSSCPTVYTVALPADSARVRAFVLDAANSPLAESRLWTKQA